MGEDTESPHQVAPLSKHTTYCLLGGTIGGAGLAAPKLAGM